MDEATKTEAGCRAFEILTGIVEEFDDVYVSLACTGGLLAHGSSGIIAEVAKTMEEFSKKDPHELSPLLDLLPNHPVVALIRTPPAETFTKVERQMSISALISAHAFFEAAIIDLLKLTMICDRTRWLDMISAKSLAFADLAAKGLERCADDLFLKELTKLSLAGVPTLVRRLLGFCKGNVTTKSELCGYVLDLERLKLLDQRRHDYAHRRTKGFYSIKQAEADTRYLTLTGVHLVICIMDAFDLKGQRRKN